MTLESAAPITLVPRFWRMYLPLWLIRRWRLPATPALILPVAVIGILFESIGDFQLVAFKANPANAGKVLQTGLWRYTRHPNYFGDACVWWGLFLIAAEAPLGLWSLPGPLLITFLLTRFSGVPTVEARMRETRPGYDDYVRRTSGFFPLPPRRR